MISTHSPEKQNLLMYCPLVLAATAGSNRPLTVLESHSWAANSRNRQHGVNMMERLGQRKGFKNETWRRESSKTASSQPGLKRLCSNLQCDPAQCQSKAPSKANVNQWETSSHDQLSQYQNDLYIYMYLITFHTLTGVIVLTCT